MQHLRWSEVIKSIRSIYPNVTDSVILSLKDRVKKSLDNQMGMIGSKKIAGNVISIDDARVYKNPTSEQIKNLLQKAERLELRALVDPINYDLYVWDALK